MKDPEQALAAAREAARGSSDREEEPEHWLPEDPVASRRQLLEWAIIEPDRASVYSTRPYGRPITWLKRGLVRFLRQYLVELSAQQSRFNALLAAHVIRLEARVEELERAATEREPDRGT